MEGLRLFDEVFAEDMERNGDLDFSEIEDVDGVEEYEDEIDYNDDWYNYHTVTFKYQGKYYTFEYKTHTSDNVCDTQYFIGTFKETRKKVTVEIREYQEDEEISLDKEWYSLAEVMEILKLSPYEIHKLLQEVEEDE